MSFEKETLKKLVLTIAFVSVMLLVILYLTNALRQGNIPGTVKVETLMLDESVYGNTSFDSSSLKFRPIFDKNVNSSLNNVIKISFNVGGSDKNTLDKVIYDVALVDLKVDCDLISPYIKWKLVKNNKEDFVGNLDYRFDTISNGRLVLTDIQQDLVNYSTDKSVYDHYDFYMWFSDSCQDEDISNCVGAIDQSNLLNKVISGKIEVELYGGDKKELVRSPSDELDKNTCIYNGGDSDE